VTPHTICKSIGGGRARPPPFSFLLRPVENRFRKQHRADWFPHFAAAQPWPPSVLDTGLARTPLRLDQGLVSF
jgi:hypothetical protein